MFDCIFKCAHPPVRDTCSLAAAKQLMSQWVRPVAETVKLIWENQILAQQYQLNILHKSLSTQDGSLPQLSFRVTKSRKRPTVCINTE